MAEFYRPDGIQIGKKEFIEYYNNRYYLDSEIVKGVNRAVNQNSKFIEDKMDELLKCGIKDIIHILAWKTGKIKHKESEIAKNFVYHSDWKINEETKEYSIKRYRENFEVLDFANYIISNIVELHIESKTNPQNFIDKLK